MPPVYTAEDLKQLARTVKSILLFGPPFTGKTRSLWTLVAYLKEMNLGPLHLLDLDRKCESLVIKCDKEGLLSHLVVIRLSVRDQLTGGVGRVVRSKDAFEEVQLLINNYKKQIDFATATWVKTYTEAPGAVIGDSLSVFCDICMEYILAGVGHELNAPNTDARDDYGRAMAKILEGVQSLKTLPCITGWIAHAELMQSGLDGKILRLPLVTGKKLSPKLAKEFNCTIYSPPPTKKDNKDVYQWQIHGGENGVESAGVTSRDDLPTFIDQDYRKVFG